MGIESAVYRFVPRERDSAPARAALVEAGAEVVGPNHLVLAGPQYWIDVEIDVPPPMVSLRVAFTNPPLIVKELRDVFATLEGSGYGEVVDMAAHDRFGVDDKACLEQLLRVFELRREAFQRDFGPFEAAVSANEVFKLLRAHRSHGE